MLGVNGKHIENDSCTTYVFYIIPLKFHPSHHLSSIVIMYFEWPLDETEQLYSYIIYETYLTVWYLQSVILYA